MTVASIVSPCLSFELFDPTPGVTRVVSDSLLERVASGEMSAMQSCIDTYGGLIWSLARRFCPSAAEAEDAVQEAFISLWENADRFDTSKGAEVTFVAMIARRRLIDRGRRYQRQQRVLNEAKTREPTGEREQDETTATVDEAGRAMQAMASLSENQQRVLRLAIHQGYTHDQIAQITDLPLGTVKTHARRGLMRIRELLKPTDTGERDGTGEKVGSNP